MPLFTKKLTGDISLYLTLVMGLLMLTATIFMSLILTRQLKATAAVEASERAFYAANTGLEEVLYLLVQKGEERVSLDSVELSYDSSDKATYSTDGTEATINSDTGIVCVPLVKGVYGGEERRITMMPADCVVP